MKIKICFIILIVFILFILPLNNTYAKSSISEIVKGADQSFLGSGSIDDTTFNNEQLEETSDFIFRILLTIGIIIMMIVGTIIGIKFMISSVDEKADIKKALVPYIVGCAVIFGAFTIWKMVVEIGQNILPTPEKTVQTEPEQQEETLHDEGHEGKIDQ